MANETLNGLKVTVTIRGSVVGTDGGRQDVDITYERSFEDGTSTNQAQALFFDEVKAVAQAGEDLDLNGSATYKDFKGSALDMVQMSLLYVENMDTDTGDSVNVTRPASNGVTGMLGASDAVTVQPGGLLLWIAPIDKATVTANTGDLINLAAADAAGSNVKLLIVGDNT